MRCIEKGCHLILTTGRNARHVRHFYFWDIIFWFGPVSKKKKKKKERKKEKKKKRKGKEKRTVTLPSRWTKKFTLSFISRFIPSYLTLLFETRSKLTRIRISQSLTWLLQANERTSTHFPDFAPAIVTSKLSPVNYVYSNFQHPRYPEFRDDLELLWNMRITIRIEYKIWKKINLVTFKSNSISINRMVRLVILNQWKWMLK